MLAHSVYLEHVAPPILIEGLREALSTRGEKLTGPQVQDLWEDRTTAVARPSRAKVENESAKSRGRGLGILILL